MKSGKISFYSAFEALNFMEDHFTFPELNGHNPTSDGTYKIGATGTLVLSDDRKTIEFNTK